MELNIIRNMTPNVDDAIEDTKKRLNTWENSNLSNFKSPQQL